MLSEPPILTAWLVGLAAMAILLGAAPWLAWRRLDAARPELGGAAGPYRSAEPARAAPSGRGTAVLVVGVLHLLSAPLALVLDVGRALSWDSSTAGDTTGTVIVFANVPVGLVAGLALVVIGARVRAGRPTSPIHGAALASFAAWMFATGVAIALASFGLVGLVSAGATWVALLAVAASLARTTSDADEAALGRHVAASIGLAVFAASGGVASFWIAGELGDRLSNHRSAAADAFYVAMQPPMFLLSATFFAASLAALGAAWASRRLRARRSG